MSVKKKIILTSVTAFVLIVGIAVGAFAINTGVSADQYQKYYDLGCKYLSEGDYEASVTAFAAALKFDRGNPDAVLGLAEAYIHTGDFDAASDLLDTLDVPDQARQEKLAQLLDLISLNLVLRSVDTSSFPSVQIEISYNGESFNAAENNFHVLENGEERDIVSLTANSQTITLVFMAASTVTENELRKVRIGFQHKGLYMTADITYQTPEFKAADVSLVSTDASDFPMIRAYFSVENPDTGEPVDHIPESAFKIEEKLEGGKYLAREIENVSQLESNAGIAIDLVADKSGSISDEDMLRVKQVLSEFVSQLQYGVGDVAEILAFDTTVSVLSDFTNDPESLNQGISYMTSYGSTAFYDALIAAVNRVSQQSGSRCVAAFTDGLDNSSTNSSDDVISYAIECGVPVFIIGVGSDIDETTLRNIAESTGGAYWYIDSLYDLDQIYKTIYTDQKKLYVVEYKTDDSSDLNQTRDITVSFAGNGFKSEYNVAFTPTVVAADNGGVRVDDPTGLYSIIDSNEIDRIVQNTCGEGTNFTVFVKDLGTGAEFGTANAKTALSASALINIPVLFTIADAIADGSIDIKTKIPFSYTYPGRGIIKPESDGTDMTIEYLMACMLKYSDNNATNSLINYLTLDRINNVCHNYDFLSVNMQRLLVAGATTSPDNYISASDLAGMLEMLYSDSFGLGKNYLTSNFVIQDSQKNVGVGKYLDSTSLFLNHNAILPNKYNELALISDGATTYIIAVMSDNGSSQSAADAAAAISKYVYQCIDGLH